MGQLIRILSSKVYHCHLGEGGQSDETLAGLSWKMVKALVQLILGEQGWLGGRSIVRPPLLPARFLLSGDNVGRRSQIQLYA